MIPLFNSQPWVAEAVCPTVDADIFHPEKGGSTAAAKLVCAGCPVQIPCLQWALDNDERWGVFGGRSERERRRIRRGEILTALPEPIERRKTRCDWCRKRFTGTDRFCSVACSSSSARARHAEDARLRRAAKAS